MKRGSCWRKQTLSTAAVSEKSTLLPCPLLPCTLLPCPLLPCSAQEPRSRRTGARWGPTPAHPAEAGGDGTTPGPEPHGQSSVRCHHRNATIAPSSGSGCPCPEPCGAAHALVCPRALPRVTPGQGRGSEHPNTPARPPRPGQPRASLRASALPQAGAQPPQGCSPGGRGWTRSSGCGERQRAQLTRLA